MNNGPIVPTVSVCLCVSRELNTIDSPPVSDLFLTGKKYVRYTRLEAFLLNSMSRDLKHNLILWGHLINKMIRNIFGRSGSSRRQVPRRFSILLRQSEYLFARGIRIIKTFGL